jgi:hypothetical protein
MDLTLPNTSPKADVTKIDNKEFLPSEEECESLDISFIHHITHILAENIPHPFLQEMSQKSDFALLDFCLTSRRTKAMR